MTTEQRSTCGELRAAADKEGEGIIEGYAAVWGTTDDYNSQFQRGAFAKTLQERGSRIKILWNHSPEVIGVPLEIREDDRGLFIRAKLVLSTARAQEVYDLVKARAVDTLSFGFKTIKDKWVNGVRVITEAALMEISPVIFAANNSAVITGVRAMDQNQQTDKQAELRAKAYADTYAKCELSQRGDLIMSALRRTLDDIWYSSDEFPQKREAVAAALAEFAGMYGAYADDLIANQTPDQSMGSEVAIAMRKTLSEADQTPEQFAASTSLTITEVRAMLAGQPDVDPDKLDDLPEELRSAVEASRSAKIETLCMEIRSGLKPEDADRIRGLLSTLPVADSTENALVAHLNQFRNSLKEQ